VPIEWTEAHIKIGKLFIGHGEPYLGAIYGIDGSEAISRAYVLADIRILFSHTPRIRCYDAGTNEVQFGLFYRRLGSLEKRTSLFKLRFSQHKWTRLA